MSIREHLEAHYAEHGELDPAKIVQVAKKVAHPLHTYFEWDDKKAGHQYRLIQAEHHIRSVTVVYREDGDDIRTVRRYHPVRTAAGQTSYRVVEEIRADPFQRELLLRQMERDWMIFRRRGAPARGGVAGGPACRSMAFRRRVEISGFRAGLR